MRINNQNVVGDKFAFDGCHKIYIIEDEIDRKEAEEYDYEIFDLKELKDKYENSCSLKFISNWKLDKQYVRQFEDASFGEDNSMEM